MAVVRAEGGSKEAGGAVEGPAAGVDEAEGEGGGGDGFEEGAAPGAEGVDAGAEGEGLVGRERGVSGVVMEQRWEGGVRRCCCR